MPPVVAPEFNRNSAEIQEIITQIIAILAKKEVVFVRHGESQAVLDKVYAGCKLDSPLTPKGISEAHEAIASLIKAKFQPSAIISSGLARADETAKIAAQEIQFQKEIIKNDALQERNWGSWTAKEKGYKTGLKPKDFSESEKYEEPENDAVLGKRVLQGFKDILSRDDVGNKLLFVSHLGVMTNLIEAISGIQIDKASLETCAIFKISNATIFRFDNDQFVQFAEIKPTSRPADTIAAAAAANVPSITNG